MNLNLNPVLSDNRCAVAIVGAGPYGLAAAAHLRAAHVQVRVFGEAMSFWRGNMPSGMKLRSPWIATHIADPLGRYLLDDYFAEKDLPHPDLLPVGDFIGYGAWFQQHVAPNLDTRKVVHIRARDGGFRLSLEDGENVFAERVIIATGLLNHEYRPPQFDGLPSELVSHSCEHTASDRFRGRHVLVIGRGQSACESAALLHEAGANVEIICRGTLAWNGDPEKRGALRKTVRSMLGKALIPPSQVGPFPFNWLVEAPAVIGHFPQHARDRLNTHCLRPTAILWLRPRLRDIVVRERSHILEARRDGDRIVLTTNDGTRHLDHVLLATGYRIDVERMSILDQELRRRIRRHQGLPILSAGFESSVGGLHFIGSFAVGSFGPLLRFIAGAGFAARRITQAALGRSSQASAERDFDSPGRAGPGMAAPDQRS